MKPKGPVLSGLSVLAEAIQQAENFLRTIPSSQSGRCLTAFKYNTTEYYLFYSNKKLKLSFIDNEEEIVSDLSGFPSSIRIEASKYIPPLIDLALDLEPEIEIEATQVAQLITNKIKQHLES